ncbi:hypothetical protein [Sorangium sp. So ce1024]|uniref:hypothetical protein n=1 Tax=Sorangium sp. So ce1024 TaxID=3133327 RepID=UPI003EFF8EEF
MTEHEAEQPAARRRVPIYRGWDAISQALDVSVDTAMAYAARGFDPLPIQYDHAGRPVIPVSALEDWEERNSLPFHAYHHLKQAGKLPAQIAQEIERKAAQRTKVARRGPRKPGVRVDSATGAQVRGTARE